MIYNTDDIRSKPLVNLSDGKRKNMPGDIYIYIYIYITAYIYIYIYIYISQHIHIRFMLLANQ